MGVPLLVCVCVCNSSSAVAGLLLHELERVAADDAVADEAGAVWLALEEKAAG